MGRDQHVEPRTRRCLRQQGGLCPERRSAARRGKGLGFPSPPRGQRLHGRAPATGRHKPLAHSPAGQGLQTAPTARLSTGPGRLRPAPGRATRPAACRARLEVLVFQHGAHHQLLVAEVPEGSHVEGHVGEDNQVLQESKDGVNWQRKHSGLVGSAALRPDLPPNLGDLLGTGPRAARTRGRGSVPGLSQMQGRGGEEKGGWAPSHVRAPAAPQPL